MLVPEVGAQGSRNWVHIPRTRKDVSSPYSGGNNKAVPTTSSERRLEGCESFVSFGPSVFYDDHIMKWLILRGLVREQRHWGDFPEVLLSSLRQSHPEVQIHMLDFPGFGTESGRASPFSIDGIVDDVRARWLQLPKSADEPCFLLAVSLGGMVAMNWVSRYPSDFRGLALINSSATGLSPVTKRLKPENYPRILSLFASNNVEERERKILEMTTNLKGDSLLHLARKHAGFAKKVRKKDALAQIVSALRFKPPKEIRIPLIVLGGKKDGLVDVSCSVRIADRFGGRLELHETGNHDLATDDSPWIAGKLKHWMASVQS